MTFLYNDFIFIYYDFLVEKLDSHILKTKIIIFFKITSICSYIIIYSQILWLKYL